jgi:hypothetical protein
VLLNQHEERLRLAPRVVKFIEENMLDITIHNKTELVQIVVISK